MQPRSRGGMMNMHRLTNSLLSRQRACRSLSSKARSGRREISNSGVAPLISAALAGGLVLLSPPRDTPSVSAPPLREGVIRSNSILSKVSCEEDEFNLSEQIGADVDIVFDEDMGVASGFPESIQFEQCLAYHRLLLPEYRQRWQWGKDKTPTTAEWPRGVPTIAEMPSLEVDWEFCNRKRERQNEAQQHYCDNLQFRLATFYLQQTEDPQVQRKGVKLLKTLAERGHVDAMCMWGVVLNEGRVAGVESHPGMATVWWRRAVDDHRHVQSTYELAVAFYTGEGIVEDEEMAVKYFRRAATLGHPGAAYMLGDCLLDGVGTRRDRAEALEWLVTAAELGHRGARSRVLAVLETKEGKDYGRFTDSSRQTLVETVQQSSEDEAKKWNHGEEDGSVLREASIERRFTIGGGSRNPVVLARRKTVVAESRNP